MFYKVFFKKRMDMVIETQLNMTLNDSVPALRLKVVY